MIRAEALLEVDNFLDNENDFNNIKKLINKIYNDFESRLCKNCKYYHQGWWCLQFGDKLPEPDEDFGCNKFERAKNERNCC